MLVKALDKPCYMLVWCGGSEMPAIDFFTDLGEAKIRFEELKSECDLPFEMLVIYEMYIDPKKGRLVKVVHNWMYEEEEYIPAV